MPNLFPAQVSAEEFLPGECVRKFVSDRAVTPYVGVVTQVSPAACKVWVQWPMSNSQEDPQDLIKVNPAIAGLPTALRDRGYSSYEKAKSESMYGMTPKAASENDKMALRVAHTFATDVVGKLVDDILACKEEKLSDVQAYNRIYRKFSNICSDHILRSSVKRVYSNLDK